MRYSLFTFLNKDRGHIRSICRSLRVLLCRPALAPLHYHSLAKLLLGFESLPRATSRLHVELRLRRRVDDLQTESQGIIIDDTQLVLSFGATDIRPGGEASYDVVFRSTTDGTREDESGDGLGVWAEVFAERVMDATQELSFFNDFSHDHEIDWSPEPSDQLWGQSATEHP